MARWIDRILDGISAAALAVVAFLLRWTAWLLIRLIYRIRVVGSAHIPAHGPALLVCNHVTWIDAVFIYFSSRRQVRFLVWAPWTKVPGLRFILRLAGAIPISAEGGARGISKSLREASAALARGELVCIFAEGRITRTGLLLPFQRGLEQIVRRSPAPIIPTALDRLWGSIFSYQSGKFFWKWPQMIPYPVTVAFGKPMPATSSAWEVRQAVQVLLADCFNLRKETHKPAHRQFVRMACQHPLRPCLIDPTPNGRRLNYGQTLTGAAMLARYFRPIFGAQPMIGVLLPTTVASAVANIAISLLGKTAVNLNFTASKESMLSAVEQCQIRYVITARAFRERFKFDLGAGVTLIDLEEVAPHLGKLRRALLYLSILCLPRVVTEYLTLGLGKHRSDQLATVIFSSGSTGAPKGVMLSHHNIVSNAESVCQAIDLSPKDRLMAVLPMFHSFGYTVTLWMPLMIGASIVYYPDPRQAKEIGDFIREFKCSMFVTTPTFLRFIHRRCQRGDLASIRLLITGAEKLPQAFAREFEEKFGIYPLEGYGTTELSPVVSVNVPDWGEDGDRQIGHKPGTIGQPLPGVAAKVVDVNTGEPLPPNQDGMLLVYGPNVMVGYLNRPEATAEAIRDGWYVTGDIARIDNDGFITITDRLSRFSKVGGEMVPHQRVEEQLHQILQTTERKVAVTGLPDLRKGERLVVLHTALNGWTPQTLHEQLAASGLPNLWLPDRSAYYEIPEIPVLASGKLDLQKVKKLAAERAGTAERAGAA